jgi:hypothetical protein
MHAPSAAPGAFHRRAVEYLDTGGYDTAYH